MFRPTINAQVETYLSQLYKFQERAKASDAVRAKTKRRFVAGLKEVLKGIKANRYIFIHFFHHYTILLQHCLELYFIYQCH